MTTATPFLLEIDRRIARAPQVYQALRAAILDLHLKPGTPISENWICQQCGVSRTPAREALIRLTHEHLIVVFPQHGSFVAPIRLRRVIEASFVREALETLILKMASAVWKETDTAAATAILARQRMHVASNEHGGFFTEDQNFHRYIATVAGAEGMLAVIDETATDLVRIRRLLDPTNGHMEQALDDHQCILDQLAFGNVDGAVQKLTEHLSRVFRKYDFVTKTQPEYFEDSNGVRDQIPEAMRRYLSSYAASDVAAA
jgi:DNA-binding GntR family transcriptional regulator